MSKYFNYLEFLTTELGLTHAAEQNAGGDYKGRGLPITKGRLEEHTKGRLTLAANVVAPDHTTRLVMFDFDRGAEQWPQVEQLARALAKDGINYALSNSGRKGYGLWVRFTGPVQAAVARAWARALRERVLGATYGTELAQAVEIRPDTNTHTIAAQGRVKIPVCKHQVSGLWSGWCELENGPHPVGFDARPIATNQVPVLEKWQATPVAVLDAVAPYQEATHNDQAPDLSVLEGHPPCINALVQGGVPSEAQYNQANLNLAKYANDRNLDGLPLAQAMARCSTDHPTSKTTEAAKVRNYESNHAQTGFRCGYMRGLPGLRFSCTGCAVNTAEAVKGFGATEVAPAKAAPPQVRLEAPTERLLLAWAISTQQRLPNLAGIWSVHSDPLGDVEPALAVVEVLGRKFTTAAYFDAVDRLHPHYRTGAAQYLTELQATQTDEKEGRAALLRAKELKRQLDIKTAAREAIRAENTTPANVTAAKLTKTLKTALEGVTEAAPLANYKETLLNTLTTEERRHIPTPFTQLNDLLGGGWQAGSLYTLIAPPKEGKTTLAAACMDYAAEHGAPVLYMGYEMRKYDLCIYAVARRLGLDARRIISNRLTVEEAEQVAGGIEAYLNAVGENLTILEAGASNTLADAAAWIDQQPEGAIPLVVVDYLQIAKTGVSEIDNHASDTKRVTELAIATKDLARSSDAALLVLSSVTKEAENMARTTGYVDITAARDSLSIIHASDAVMTFTGRMYTPGNDKPPVDPWQFLADNDPEAGVLIARKIEKYNGTHPAKEGWPSYGERARLSLVRNRGPVGDIPLYYRKAYHQLIEVDLGLNPGGDDRYDRAAARAAIRGYTGGVVNTNNAFNNDVFNKYDNQASSVTPTTAEEAPTQEPTPLDGYGAPYQYITDTTEAVALLEPLAGELIGLDIETYGPGPRGGLDPIEGAIRLVQVYHPSLERVLVLDVAEVDLKALTPALERLNPVAHNAAFESSFLTAAGVSLAYQCSYLAAHTLEGSARGPSLANACKQYLDVTLDKAQQTSDWGAPELSPEQLAYAALDAQAAYDLYKVLARKLKDADLYQAYQLQIGALDAVTALRLNGFMFDTERHQETLEGLAKQKAELAEYLSAQLPDINPNSGPQLGAWITEQLGGESSPRYEQWPKTAKGALQTGKDQLQANVYLLDEMAHPVVERLITHKDVEKRLTAFGTKLADKVAPTTKRLHAEFRLGATVTGRMSCAEPNLQQIPRGAFRELFVAAPGSQLVAADYSQVELRVAAIIANEEKLLTAYDSGADVHTETAALIMGKKPEDVTKADRQAAKAVNFGLLFGQGAPGLQRYAKQSYGVTLSEAQAKTFRKVWLEAYPAINQWQQQTIATSKRTLQAKTPGGRIRPFTRETFKPTEALNTPIQGGAAEVTATALAKVQAALKPHKGYIRLVSVIHDEIILEAADSHLAEAKAILAEGMRQAFVERLGERATTDLVEVSTGPNWASVK